MSHDLVLRNDFIAELSKFIEPYVEKLSQRSHVEHLPNLVINSLGEIFYQQGLEVISYMNNKHHSLNAIDLKSIVQSKASKIQESQKAQGELANIAAELIYEIIWRPSKIQREYCGSMAKTFSLMFLGKADPQVLKGLKQTASSLLLILGTDIVVKILAEVHLEKEYQRFTNLIRSLKDSGVKLLLTDGVLREAASHIRSTISWYDTHVRIWLSEVAQNPEVKELIDYEERFSRKILVRAFNHAKSSGKYADLKELLNGFVNVGAGRYENDLREYFEGEFGIEKISRFIDEQSQEFQWIFSQIDGVAFRGHENHSRQRIIHNDATTINAVYDMRREFTKPVSNSFLLNERVWWLTSERKIERIKKSFEEKFGDVPNIPPLVVAGLLSNLTEVTSASKQANDTLSAALGLNMSHFVGDDLVTQLSLSYGEIKEMSPGKKKQTIGLLIEKLRKGEIKSIEGSLQHALDEVADYEKSIEELIALNSNSGPKAVWEKVKNGEKDPVVRLLMFCEATGFKRMAAVEQIRVMGFTDDVKGIQKSVLKSLGYQE